MKLNIDDNVFICATPDNNFTPLPVSLHAYPIPKMFKFSIFLALVTTIAGGDICANKLCVCRDNSKDERDHIGENVDCSYNGGENILRTNYTLPSGVYSLTLSSNNIGQLAPTNLLDSTTLVELKLNKNAIKEIHAKVLLLPEMRRLDLSDNELQYIDKEAFRDVNKLEYLNLANNKLTEGNVAFHRLSNLNEIILDNNDLGSSLREINLFNRKGFGLTSKIKSLSISGINLNKVPDNFFSEAYDIRKLIISRNNLTDIFELPFTLEYLDLSDNPITEISEEDFSDLPGLKVLKLNNLKISEVPGFVFVPLHSLVELQLERNRNLTVFSSLAFGQEVLEDADNFSLERLSLMGSRLSRLEASLAEPLGRLLTLDLQGNPWRCDCDITWIKDLQIPPEYYEHVRCGWPKVLYNSKIFELDSKYFSCTLSHSHVGFAVSVAAVIAALTAVAIWLFLCIPKVQTTFRNMASPMVAYSLLPVNNARLNGL